jgi:hypothetical protein
MDDDVRPVVVAFDGSPESQAALRAAASLFHDRCWWSSGVWEPGMGGWRRSRFPTPPA